MTPSQIVLRRLRRRKILKVAAGYIVIFAFLGAVAFITGNPLGMAFFVITFIALRYCYNDGVTFHFESAVVCAAVTCGMFVVVGIFLMPISLGISILAPVLIGLGITWLAHWLGKTLLLRDENSILRVKELERKTETDGLKAEIEELKKAAYLYGLKICELTELCNKKGLSKVESKIAKEEFFEKTPKTEIGEKVGYSRSHTVRLRRKIYKKLGVKFAERGYDGKAA